MELDNELKNKKIGIRYDRFILTFSYEAVALLIENEIQRLSKESDYPVDFPIEYIENTDPQNQCIAYFKHDQKPICFCFFLNRFDGTSANQIIEITRHEFAHYISLLRNGVIPDCHGPEWKKICLEIGAIPKTYHYNTMTKQIVYNT